MSYFRPIFLIAGNTITGILRGVVLNVLLVLAAIAILLGILSTGTIKASELHTMIVNSGLAAVTLLGALIAILTGFTMIPGEIETRTVYPVLAKPVRRWQFVLGKFFGAAGINAITIGLLSLLFFVACFVKLKNQPFDSRLVLAVLMIYFMITVLSGLIIFFSTFMSWIGTIIASMVIWGIGNYSQFIHDMSLGSASSSGFSKNLLNLVQHLIPNFQAMDLRYDIVQIGTVHFDAIRILKPVGDGCLYLVAVLALAILIFNYREL